MGVDQSSFSLGHFTLTPLKVSPQSVPSLSTSFCPPPSYFGSPRKAPSPPIEDPSQVPKSQGGGFKKKGESWSWTSPIFFLISSHPKSQPKNAENIHNLKIFRISKPNKSTKKQHKSTRLTKAPPPHSDDFVAKFTPKRKKSEEVLM